MLSVIDANCNPNNNSNLMSCMVLKWQKIQTNSHISLLGDHIPKTESHEHCTVQFVITGTSRTTLLQVFMRMVWCDGQSSQ